MEILLASTALIDFFEWISYINAPNIMERSRNVSADVERLKDVLKRNLPSEFVEYLIYPKTQRGGYKASPSPTGTEQYQVLADEKWDEGRREVISYDDGTITLKIQEKNPDVNIQIVLTRDQNLILTGLLPFSDVIGVLWRTRENNNFSLRNLTTPDDIIRGIDFLKFLSPERYLQTKGIECSFEFNPEGKLLVKEAYLAD